MIPDEVVWISVVVVEVFRLILVTFAPIVPIFVVVTLRNFCGLLPNQTFSIDRFSFSLLTLVENVLASTVSYPERLEFDQVTIPVPVITVAVSKSALVIILLSALRVFILLEILTRNHYCRVACIFSNRHISTIGNGI